MGQLQGKERMLTPGEGGRVHGCESGVKPSGWQEGTPVANAFYQRQSPVDRFRETAGQVCGSLYL